MKRESKKKAFTLLELLIVMVIIGVLAIIAIPQYLGAVRSAEDTNAISELKVVREMIQGYQSMGLTLPALTAGTELALTVWKDAAGVPIPGTEGKSYTLQNDVTCTAIACTTTSKSGNTVAIQLGSGATLVTPKAD